MTMGRKPAGADNPPAMSDQTPTMAPGPSLGQVVSGGVALPALVLRTGEKAQRRFLEFFAAHLRNPNTRLAYARAAGRFLDWCAARGVERLEAIGPMQVAAWTELRLREVSAPTVKQELAALRRLFDWLVVGQVLPHNPSASVRGPAHSAVTGKTPILSAGEARTLLRSIADTTIVGLRDRALIATMIYTFARVSAALGLDAGDVFRERHRLHLRLHEKAGKVHRMPCHHNLESWLGIYMAEAGFEAADTATPVFQSIGRGTRALSGRRLSRHEAWAMVRRRARAARIETVVSNHTFRGTGITAYLEHPDAKLEEAQKMAGHADPKTTRLYDRRRQTVSLDEVERIGI